jgi:nitrogen fixation NifU-like protein
MSDSTTGFSENSLPAAEADDAAAHRAIPYQKSTGPKTADGHGKRTSDCGDLIEFFIQVNDDTVQDVTCHVSGCTNTFASARAAGMLVKGKTVQEAIKAVTPSNIDQRAALPEESKHCAKMAAEAMKAALTDAALSAREPWRKLYRKI